MYSMFEGYQPELHSLRCRSCSSSLSSLSETSCCKRRVSMCGRCFVDDKCPDCIGESVSTGFVQVASSMAMVKVTTIENYHPGDIVLFHPVLERVGSLDPHLNLLHINKPKPFVLLHDDCYASFGRDKGKLCDIVIARLTGFITETEPTVSQQLHRSFREEEGREGKVMFYTVSAVPVGIGFPSVSSCYKP